MSKPSNSRIKRFEYVKGSQLIDNERNWRKHPAPQRSALKDMLARIGYIDALVVRETPQGLEIIDGHLRKDVSGAQQVPVLVVDLDDDEALEALATLDPMAALAAPDEQMLEDLLADLINVGDEQLNEVLEAVHSIPNASEFEPTDAGDQSRLDERGEREIIKCPSCGHEFQH